MNEESLTSFNLPEEGISFYYSKSKIVIVYFYNFIPVSLLLYFIRIKPSFNLTALENNIVQVVLVIILIFLSVISFKKYFDNDIQLKISNDGIWLKELGFYKWGDIAKTDVRRGFGSRDTIRSVYLCLYLVNNSSVSVEISDIKDANKILDTINIYNKKELTEQELQEKIREGKSIKIFLIFVGSLIFFSICWGVIRDFYR